MCSVKVNVEDEVLNLEDFAHGEEEECSSIEEKQSEQDERLCTCGSGEEAYLCSGTTEDGSAYCG